ncbi:MAG: ATP-dependent helicase HrpB [Myxococcales bacterium]|nr:ATP-dependent helicase HrpB [Myxococcales bacterium]
MDHARQVEHVSKTEKATLKKTSSVAEREQVTARASEPVAQKEQVSKSANGLANMLGGIERGQGVMDKLIKLGVSGHNFSSSQLLTLQASMYRYTQELELTGKVVEKATTGLKDTLKTQV